MSKFLIKLRLFWNCSTPSQRGSSAHLTWKWLTPLLFNVYHWARVHLSSRGEKDRQMGYLEPYRIYAIKILRVSTFSRTWTTEDFYGIDWKPNLSEIDKGHITPPDHTISKQYHRTIPYLYQTPGPPPLTMPPVPPHHSLKQSLRFSSFFIYSHAVITPKWRDEILVLLTFIPQLNIFIVICPICPIFTTVNTLKHTSAIPDGIFGSASQSVTFKSPSVVHATVGGFGVQV